MWRPFASNFADHTFANFTKKTNRVGSAPVNTRRERPEEYETSSIASLTSIVSQEAQQRFGEYIQLQKTVKTQRNKIKVNDINLDKLKQFRMRTMKLFQENEKDKRQQELQRIRAFSTNKAPKAHVLDLRPQTQSLPVAEETPISMSPRKIRNKFTAYNPQIIFKPNPHRTSLTVREFQDKMMKSLKSKVPTYIAELSKEFSKIRDHSEMTFEQYNVSKKLRRTNPYKIRPKIKS